jgi:hypothetical protein
LLTIYLNADADNIESGSGNVVVSVQLEREMSEPELSPVHSLYFPKEKAEGTLYSYPLIFTKQIVDLFGKLNFVFFLSNTKMAQKVGGF